MSFIFCRSADVERRLDRYLSAFGLGLPAKSTAQHTRIGKLGRDAYLLHSTSQLHATHDRQWWGLAGEAFPPPGPELPEDVAGVHGEFCALGVDEHASSATLIGGRTGAAAIYLFTESSLVCASDDLRLLVDGIRSIGIRLTIDEEYVGLFLSSLPVDQLAPRLQPTVFSQVRAIPPGCRATISVDHGLSVHRYWYYWQGERLTGRRLVEEVRHSVLDVVAGYARRARTGILLSGGIDSSCVAGALAAVSEPPIRLYNNCFRSNPSLDESPYVEAVANHTKGVVTSIDSERLWTLRGVPDRTAWRQMEPNQGWFYLQEKMTAHAARKDGIAYLLDGQGGDELFAPSLEGGTFLLGHRDCLDRQRYLRLMADIRDGRRESEPLSRLVVRGHHTPPFLTPRLVKAAGTVEHLPRLLETFAYLRLDALTAMRVFNFQCMNLGMGDRTWENREVCAQIGVRRAQPLLDSRLVECVFRAPMGEVIEMGLCKPLLLRAMSGLVPQLVQRRRHKTSFEVISRRGIGREGKEIDRVRMLMTEGLIFEHGFVEKKRFLNYFEDIYLQDRLDVLRQRWLKYWIWRAVVLELWLRAWVRDLDMRSIEHRPLPAERWAQ